MATGSDLYAVLGVAKTASADDIRRAYRALAKRYHPDVNPGDAAAEERFKEISAAYDVLSDGPKRALYDEFGPDGLREGFDAGKARKYRQWQESGGWQQAGRPGAAGGESVFDFDLSDLFGGATDRSARPRRGRDVMATVEIDFGQALRGTELQYNTPDGNVVTVRIPPGADTGSKLRVPGHGEPGRHGGPPGDLILSTVIRPHPFFRRDGRDLTLRLPVTLDEAYSGATVEVPTPAGPVHLKIPPRSQQGARLRLRGKGVTRGAHTGDLYVELDVRLPDRDDPHFAEAARLARDAYTTAVRQDVHL